MKDLTIDYWSGAKVQWDKRLKIIESKEEFMKKVKITVIECTFNKELAQKYAGEGLTTCTYNQSGQVFYTNGWQKPEGLCDNAWKSMMEYAMTLAHGGNDFYDGWMKDKNSAIVTCNDGFRPVIFLLEATEEDAPVFLS